MPTPFDPLKHLQRELSAVVSLKPNGTISLTWGQRVLPERRMKAESIVRVYTALLRLQLDNGERGMLFSISLPFSRSSMQESLILAVANGTLTASALLFKLTFSL
jgi:hypothetical protein